MHFLLLLFAICGLFGLGGSTSSSSPTPLSIPPSLYWDGDDGWWSTFFVQVGTPPQTVRLLPGTSASAGSTIWVIISEGCVDVNPDLANCANERGYLFQSNLSSSWSTQGIQNGVDGAIFSLNTFEEGNLGLVGNGSYGYDTVSLGLSGSGLPTLKSQVIAGIWTDDFFLGSLGLSPVPFNFTNLNDPQPSMLGTLRNQSLIPSASWAYTAGAYYQNPPVYGSLTLGGYDRTRFTSNNLTFAFGADFSRDLLVSLQSVTYDTAGSSPLLASSIDIFIDSLTTEIWLPFTVCDAFANQFNLTWNEQGQLYLVDATAHTALLAQNPTFTFMIGYAGSSGSSGNETVDIVLPYAAFDLNLTSPIVGDTTWYFPLKRAQNASQYTLGRTFLQEAYVIADYERRNFSVSQALMPATSVAQDIVAIEPPSDRNSKPSERKLSKGVIAGIVIAAVVLLVVAFFLALRWSRWRRGRTQATATAEKVGEEGVHRQHGIQRVIEADNGGGIYEIDELSQAVLELPAHKGVLGRHELGSEVMVHEMGNGMEKSREELDEESLRERAVS